MVQEYQLLPQTMVYGMHFMVINGHILFPVALCIDKYCMIVFMFQFFFSMKDDEELSWYSIVLYCIVL